MKKVLNIALLISFVVTIMVPLTGVHIHKMASVIFLLLNIVHTITYRKMLGVKRWLLLGLILIFFTTGLCSRPPADRYHLTFQNLISFASPPFVLSATIVTKAGLQDKCATNDKNPQPPKRLGILS